MDDYLSTIEDLRQQFKIATKQEYEKHNFQEKESVAEDMEKLENKKLKHKAKTQFELDMIYKKINQISKKTSYRKKVQVNQVETQTLNKNLLNDPDIFNIVNNEKDYKDWKQLSIETQLQKAAEFFASSHYLEEDQVPYDEETKIILIEMIKDGKLYLKKDIEYDKINQRIANIPLAKYQAETKTYCIKSEEHKKNMRKMSQNAVGKIIKKNR